ncbi:MAG: hypothetical protein RI947_1350 [Candidatus Parcubacteria bacterium]|jgi:predicted ferric reductase
MKKITLYIFGFILLLPVFFFWWSNSGATLLNGGFGGSTIALARLCGLLAVYCILMQFMLMGRTAWIESLFGLDKLARIHRLNGFLALVFIVLHPILITIGYASLTGRDLLGQFLLLLTTFEDVLYAFIAVLIFITIVAFSIYIVRKRLKYETWYYVHVFTYLAVLLAWGHQLKIGEDFLASTLFTYYWYALYAFVFGNVLIFRFLVPMYMFWKHRFRVEKVVRENADTVSIYITGNNLETFHIKGGQFLIYHFLSKKFWWTPHPFSVSAITPQYIRLTVKNVGDFTSEIPEVKPGTLVYIDGPFGIFTEKVVTHDKVLCIAGGIGITPMRSLIEDLTRHNKDIILIYSNKTKEEMVLGAEFEALKKDHTLTVHYVYSQQQYDDALYGRVDKELITKLVPDLKDRDIFLCGPPVMIVNLREGLLELGVKRENIHFELFSLHVAKLNKKP